MLNGFEDLLGQFVNGLEVVGIHGRDSRDRPIWVCRCLICGTSGITMQHDSTTGFVTVGRGALRPFVANLR
jgi:hypothetical protein